MKLVSFGILAPLTIFAGLSVAAEGELMREQELAIIRSLRTLSDPGWMAEIWRDITAIGSGTALTMVVLILALLWLQQNRISEVKILLAVAVSSTIANLGLKQIFDRPRPPADLNEILVLTDSFPSGHSFQSVAILGTIAVLAADEARQRMIGLTAALIVACFIALSRIVLGVHYPTDVLAGCALGVAWISAATLARNFRVRPSQRIGLFDASSRS
jgi:undecaprenyl-diphosphatase